MTRYVFRREIELEYRNNENLDPDTLGEAVEKAEEKAYEKLYEEVSRHFIDFSINADINLTKDQNKIKIRIEMVMNLEISPLTPKIAEQDRIAREISYVFFDTVKNHILRVLGKTSH